MCPSTKQSCPPLSSSSGWQIALLDLNEQRVIQAKLMVRLASFLACHCESGVLMASIIASSMYWVPAAHGAGTWHTLSIILRAPFYGRFYYPHFTGKEIEAVRGKFEHCSARLQNPCSFSTVQCGLVFDTHAYSPSTRWWAGEALLFKKTMLLS